MRLRTISATTSGSRHDAGRAGAVDLDADHVGRRNEAGPGVADVLIAGEGAHAARHHVAARWRRPAFRSRRRCTVGVHGDHLSWIRPGHAGLRGGLVVGDYAILGEFVFRGRPSAPGADGGHLEKRAAVHHY